MPERTPLGAYYKDGKTIFRVRSEHAEKIELCLFSPDEKEEYRIALDRGEDNIWSVELEGVKPGQKYGYRAHGEYKPSRGLFFNPYKLAVDPYGFEVSQTMLHWTSPLLDIENYQDSAPIMPKSVVVDINKILSSEKYPYLHRKPHFSAGQNIIYETHIKNFSKLNHHLAEEKRGKLSGLADKWSIEYFQKVGVNNIELMPINPTCCGKQVPEKEGRTDSWGYNPYCFFAIDPRYGNWEDFANMVNELHKAGIKVTVDAVFNHTGEHAAIGPRNQSLSFKLLDSPNYYRPDGDNHDRFLNTTGCDNNFNLDSKAGQEMLHNYLLLMHSLGVDGIRWDLGGDNALDNYGRFQENGAFIQELRFAQEHLKMEMYVEPWSAMAGNFSGRFAALVPGAKEWSDNRRNFVGEFFSSRSGLIGEFGNQVAGSSNTDPHTNTSAVIGTGRSHDGFSLLGAYQYPKNTYPNGEEGRDGSPDIYQKSTNEEELYRRAMSDIAFNILSKGIPLMRNGDERGYSDANNNPYCIDDSSVWLNWEKLSGRNRKLFTMICRLNAFRKKHPIFTDLSLFDGQKVAANGAKDITWLRPDGQEMEAQDWRCGYAKTGAYMLNGSNNKGISKDDDFLILVSGDNYHTVDYKLPQPPHGGDWQLVLDTSKEAFNDTLEVCKSGETYALKPYSYVILTHKNGKERLNMRQVSFLKSRISKRRD